MMTARKRVGPFPTHRLAVRHSVDFSSSDHFSSDDSSSSSSLETSLDSTTDALSDSPSSHSSSDHSLPASPSGMRSSHRLCSLVPSVHRSSAISERPIVHCMRTRNSNFPNNSTVTIPRRRNRRRAPNVVEPKLRSIIEVAPMVEQTMEELLRAPTEGYGEAIVIPEINADHFEIKTNLLQLVQASPFHGFERENPHTHISNFKRITSTLKFRDVLNDVIKLMMLPYSLEGAARSQSLTEWKSLVLPKIRGDLLSEALERFKEMLRACPHHGFTELTQIDTFYNGLNDNDQDSLNVAAGRNLLSKTTRKALNIIENKSKVCYLRNKSNVSRMNTNSRESFSKTDERIDKLADQISTLVEICFYEVVI
ncbi:hypothetical protein Tco_1539945 [Tanacetum coccineum]